GRLIFSIVIMLVLQVACLTSSHAQPRPTDRPQRPDSMPRGRAGFGGGGRGFMNPFPLHAAAERGDIVAMERILGRGMIMIDALDPEAKTALHAAALAGQTNAVSWLVSHGQRIDVFAAAALDDVERVQTFLETDPKLVRGTGPDGITPLHWAAQKVAQLL